MCRLWIGLALLSFLQKWTTVNLKHVPTGPLVSVRGTLISVYVHLNSRDDIATKVTQYKQITSVLTARYFTSKLITVSSVTRQKRFRRRFTTVCIRTEGVITSAHRQKIQSIGVTVLLVTNWRLITDPVCRKVGFGVTEMRIYEDMVCKSSKSSDPIAITFLK